MALNEFVQTALDEEGYEEGSDGYTKYGSWYGLANADWCVMFISWCANQAGIMTTSSTGTVPNVPKMVIPKVGLSRNLSFQPVSMLISFKKFGITFLPF